MSDIPLRYIRRTRGYNPINSNDSEGDNNNLNSGRENSEMLSAFAAMQRKSNGKVKARYVDGPEEDLLLVGMGEDDGYRDTQEDLEEARSETASQVRFVLVVCEMALTFSQVAAERPTVKGQIENETIQVSRYVLIAHVEFMPTTTHPLRRTAVPLTTKHCSQPEIS
jgi:hypothetical protein